MRWEPIRKPQAVRATANLTDYASARRDFDWTAAGSALSGLPGGRGLNIAHEAVDRHATGPHATAVALSCVDRQEAVTGVPGGPA